MRKRKDLVYLLALVAFMTGCTGSHESVGRSSDTVDKSNGFPVIAQVVDSVVTLTSVVNIESWYIDSCGILCFSDATENPFYRIDRDRLCVTDSFGTKGQGPGEFIFPCVVKSPTGKTLLLDGADGELTWIFSEGSKVITNPDKMVLYNSPVEIDYPLIATNQSTPDCESVDIINMETGEKIDSIAFSYADQPSKDVSLDLCFDSDGKHIVIGKIFSDELVIATLDGGKISSVKTLKGDGAPGKRKHFYTRILCGKDRFYAWTNKDVEFLGRGEWNGNPSLEVYDYSGKPLAIMNMTYLPKTILLEEEQNRILAIVPDDEIHIISLDSLR